MENKKCLKPPTRYYSYPVTIHCGFELIGTGTLVLLFCVFFLLVVYHILNETIHQSMQSRNPMS